MTQLNAFVARSFAAQDEGRIRPILDFLDTFRRAGFFWETAEPAEVESVSAKVRRMIDEREIFIGFFTKRYPVYRFESKFRGAFQILFGNVKPNIWSAPAWVLQESGYALRGGKQLILLREPEVEVFGLQGDLEYISFDPEKPAEVFPKLSGMINGLLAKAAGTEVSVTLSERHEQSEVAIEKPVSDASADMPKPDADEEADIIVRYIEMNEASAKRDFNGIEEAWKAGKDLIASGKTKDIDLLAWHCLYYENRSEAGAADGLDSLRHLRAANPTRVEPTAAIARCLYGLREFEESADLFLEAASGQKGGVKVRSLVNAAKAFRETKQFVRGKNAIDLALSGATGELREEAVWVHYQLLRDSGDDYFAFATAESALHENPLLPLRFSLALDYRRKDFNELALHHFKFLHDRNNEDSSSLHNLALMYADCKLPIASVERYKKAISIGETLSAANLGFMYLDGGMQKEAKELVEQAMKIENHATRVEECMAEIVQRGEKEREKETALLGIANANRNFLVNMGRALTEVAPPLAGHWKFPFGEMPMTVDSNQISGTVDVKTEESGFGLLFGTPGNPKIVRIDRYMLNGELTGAVCEFKLTVADASPETSLYAGISLHSRYGTKSGFILFAPDGRSATYVELSDHKLGKPATLTKTETGDADSD
jgi:tetratricopeptide (TPR) repeat protein